MNLPFNKSEKFFAPEEYLKVQLNLTFNEALCHEDDYLLIYILSTVTNFERRKVIRSTWGSKRNKTCFVFFVGKPTGLFTNTEIIEKRIVEERKQYQDIFQIDHEESYANVVYKEIAALQWSMHFYPKISYLFKTDDDLIVDSILVSLIGQILVNNVAPNQSVISKHRPPLIAALLESNRENFFRGGWAMDYQPTLRGFGKFAVSMDVWPHPVLPAYCSGFGWLMSRNIRDKLVKASYTYPVRRTAWIGDVFISGFLARAAQVRCSGLHIDFEQTGSANCSCSMVNNPMLTVCSSTFHAGGGGAEQQKYLEYERAWRVIQLRHNLSHTTVDNC